MSDDGHKWWIWHGMTCCERCGIIKRADGKNKLCPGIVRVTPREEASPR